MVSEILMKTSYELVDFGSLQSSLNCWGFEANAELAGFQRKRRKNFREMQFIYKFNK